MSLYTSVQYSLVFHSSASRLLVFVTGCMKKCISNRLVTAEDECWTHAHVAFYFCTVWYDTDRVQNELFTTPAILWVSSQSLPAIIISNQPWNGILHDFLFVHLPCNYFIELFVFLATRKSKNMLCFMLLCCFILCCFI